MGRFNKEESARNCAIEDGPRHTIILYSRGQNRTPLTVDGWSAERESLSVLARIGAPLKTRPCTVENTERRNWALQKVDVPR